MNLLTTIMRWRGAEVLGYVEESGDEALHATAQKVLDEAEANVPFDTGRLAGTGQIVDGDLGEVFVTFATPYAPILHAHPEWSYQGGRSGHWLDDAINDPANGDTFEGEMRERWPSVL